MSTNAAELVTKFIRLNTSLGREYVNLAKLLDIYIALDLLTDWEFEVIVSSLHKEGIDLFLVLAVSFSLYLQLPQQFPYIEGYLDKQEQRIKLRVSKQLYAHNLQLAQEVADRAAGYYQQSSLAMHHSFLPLDNNSYLN